MVVINGFSAASEKRQFEGANSIPPTSAVIRTAFLSAEIQEEARLSSVNEFPTKPTPLKRLREMLHNIPKIDTCGSKSFLRDYSIGT